MHRSALQLGIALAVLLAASAQGAEPTSWHLPSYDDGARPDAERVIRQLASSGHGPIFTTSFGFRNPTIRVAKQFPNVKFQHATGYQLVPNVAVYELTDRWMQSASADAISLSDTDRRPWRSERL